MDDNTGIFAGAYDDEDVDGQADLNNLETTMNEPKKVIQALEDPSWIEAMQDELLQFKLQNVWTLVDLPNGKSAIRTKWIEAIRLFLAYASFIGFIVYQMDVKSAFLYGTIKEEVYVCQPPGFEHPYFPDKVYKVEKLYMVYIKLLKPASTPIETNKALVKDEEVEAIDVHLYRSMIGSLMYLTASRPDITFAVCACARFQVTPKVLHLHAVKRIFRYLKGNPQQEVLWIQNQMLDYGFNFMNTKIYIDNESTICIVKNPVFHSKPKHIEIRHHFIRDSYEKKLIQVIKIHTDHNVADLFTMAFDVSRPIHLVADETVYNEWEDRMKRAATTDSSLEAEFEAASKQSNDPPLLRVNTLGSGEDRMKLKELMELCTTLSKLKPEESNGFEEIIDFLSASSVQYALTVNPTIYTSCIEQFWATTKTSIRSDLNLEDARGTDCFPTATIFEELARMGYEKPYPKLSFYKAFFSPQWKFLIHIIMQCLCAKTTAWNEFSSTMASTIICLATNQKFNMSKYTFDAMVKHFEGGVKFLMYPQFVQVFINQQLGDISHHKTTYVIPSHTKKIFSNMKRKGKDFSGRVTPLFATMMVQANQEEEKIKQETKQGSAPTKSTTKETTPEENVATPSCDPPQSEKSKEFEQVEGSQDTRVQEIKEDVLEEQEKDVVEKEVSVVDSVTTAGEVITIANVEVTTVNAPTTTIDELTLAQTLIEIEVAKPKAVTSFAITTTTTRPKARGL
ncbi:putative ribonuclease H-like domain-containing protein [Tanacetum coccineum]